MWSARGTARKYNPSKHNYYSGLNEKAGKTSCRLLPSLVIYIGVVDPLGLHVL